MPRPDSKRWAAFTLIELLTVMAVIGILAAILIPTVSSVRRSANKAKTKVQFSQWAAACEAFRAEYGFYPQFDATHKVNGGAGGVGEHLFHDLLAGRRRDGSASSGSAAKQNRKRISFHSFSEGDFTPLASPTPNLLQDAFGNTDIAVIVDRDLDGIITANDYGGALPAVNNMQPTSGAGAADFPSAGLRLAVAFYAPDPSGDAANPAFIFSWK